VTIGVLARVGDSIRRTTVTQATRPSSEP